MPSLGYLIGFIYLLSIVPYSIFTLCKVITNKQYCNLLKLIPIWSPPALIVGLYLYHHYPITKERIVGTYKIDTSFYPGQNAKWQHAHFHFQITDDNQFLFYERQKDNTYKVTQGDIEWYRGSPPYLFRINMKEKHPLIDELPSLYRGNRKFYYVFDSKFGNMFYRKVR